uniref:Protein kinase domain-containing protein n=1 Tax=Lotharella oceanica TaxID=641309 RepID=A0A7S2U0C5_9EUKA|eukprot:CAMPEP_0170182984 /NCGR_PEP_ID=MMETSP0040_2-20121228/29297_1 /TAXON_ID=641309 /ORGANISM="Lotharella oceanica, Strain CCMP622" /LENGTH=331 /DNA_ID=CAMNT_0010428575 /DNA_START=24 /DNA_END=1019 /DNA_ORIENTATION=+
MGNKLTKITKTDFEKKYSAKEVLGRGSFAIVKRAVRKKDGKELAVKIIKKAKLGQKELQIVHDEVKIMDKINHPHCVKLEEIFETNKKLYLVMEKLSGGELFDRIVAKGSYSEKEASILIRSVAIALAYLHKIGIVHRDLKPENLIYADKSQESPIKITDFGLAKLKLAQGDGMMTTACGTPGYVAPEVLKKEKYNEAVDIWSLGVILYILLCGFPPFYHEKTQKLYQQIKSGSYDFPEKYWKDITPEAKELIRRMLTVDPAKRITIPQILQHPWISGSAASNRKFGKGHGERLRKLQARRKLRKTIQIIIAVNRMAHFLDTYAKEHLGKS